MIMGAFNAVVFFKTLLICAYAQRVISLFELSFLAIVSCYRPTLYFGRSRTHALLTHFHIVSMHSTFFPLQTLLYYYFLKPIQCLLLSMQTRCTTLT